jgi:hypothetical protein
MHPAVDGQPFQYRIRHPKLNLNFWPTSTISVLTEKPERHVPAALEDMQWQS